MNTNRTSEQQAIVDDLKTNYDVDTSGILFLNRHNPAEPWLPYDVLETIARKSGKFQAIEEHCINMIQAGTRVEVVHSATVTDPDGRIYTRSGVARLGEQLENEETPNEHNLAAARALNAALRAAGFNPLKAGSVVLDLKLPPKEHAIADESDSRRNDLARIHLLAAQKNLIVPSQDNPSRNDLTGYRNFLQERFQTNTTAGMGPADRARVINALTEYDPIALAVKSAA